MENAARYASLTSLGVGPEYFNNFGNTLSMSAGSAANTIRSSSVSSAIRFHAYARRTTFPPFAGVGKTLAVPYGECVRHGTLPPPRFRRRGLGVLKTFDTTQRNPVAA